MDLVSSCKDKLQYFRVRELKDVLTRLGLSKQGKKQDLIDRILAILADDQVSTMRAKKPGVAREDVARLVDDTYRKMQGSGATDLASKGLVVTSDGVPLKPKEEEVDSFQPDMKVRCPCGNSLLTESMIRFLVNSATTCMPCEASNKYLNRWYKPDPTDRETISPYKVGQRVVIKY